MVYDSALGRRSEPGLYTNSFNKHLPSTCILPGTMLISEPGENDCQVLLGNNSNFSNLCGFYDF